jgi:hypothetical protein
VAGRIQHAGHCLESPGLKEQNDLADDMIQ